jgi:hypothetical protein
MGVHEDKKKKGELKRSLTRSILEVSPIKEDAVYLNKNFQQSVTKKNFYRKNDKQGKVERQWVNHTLIVNKQ